MCDEFTESEEETALAGKGISRRQFAAMSAAVAMVACAKPSDGKTAALNESTVHIQTPDGMADAFFVHPAKGKHPGVILWPDIGGLREVFYVMGRRLAAAGYAALVVNQYYRNAPAPVLNSFAEWRTPAGQAKLAPMITGVTPAGVARDAVALVAWLDTQNAVDKRKGIGSQGYCMGGPFAIRTAAAAPGRVRAAASFHGAGLVGAAADSPNQLLARTHANFLIAIAQGDDTRAPGDKDALHAAAESAKRPAEIEVYPANHGWCVADSPVYDAAQAERAWGRLLAHYSRL
ncbi:MAG: dienelactone hydrolase family protein [Novosphingobium sp.]